MRKTWLHPGPLARSVADAALLANAMAGPHPEDDRSLPAVPPLEPADAAGMRVAFCPRPGDLPVAEAIAANAERVARALAEAGVEVDAAFRVAAAVERTTPWHPLAP